MTTTAKLHRHRARRLAEGLDEILPPWGGWAEKFETLGTNALNLADRSLSRGHAKCFVLSIMRSA